MLCWQCFVFTRAYQTSSMKSPTGRHATGRWRVESTTKAKEPRFGPIRALLFCMLYKKKLGGFGGKKPLKSIFNQGFESRGPQKSNRAYFLTPDALHIGSKGGRRAKTVIFNCFLDFLAGPTQNFAVFGSHKLFPSTFRHSRG